jgi:hypothetical protein
VHEKYIETCEKFFKLEKDLNLFGWKIDGVYIWELIRFPVFNLIMQAEGMYGQAHTQIKPSLSNKCKTFLSSLYNYIFKNPFFIPKGTILFLGHPRRKLFADGTYWDIYCDPIIENIEGKFCILESYYLNGHLKPAKTKNLYYADFLTLIDFTVSRIVRLLKKNKMACDTKSNELIHEIKSRFDVHISFENQIQKQVVGFRIRSALYSFLFDRIRPKCILVLVGYGNEAKVFAAKKKGIPVIEMQHGTLSPYHVGYNFPEGTTKRYFADYFFSFGDFWKDVAHFPIPKINIIRVGYPYLAHALEKFKNVPKKQRIVFISQGSIGAELSSFAVQLRKITSAHIDIIYKLHPGEYDRWKQEYPCLIDSGIQIIDSHSPDLYEILSSASWQIGVYSTAIYEGLAFGCMTYLVDLPGVAYMDKLIASGYAQLVQQPEDIHLNEKHVDIDVDYFFAKDWKNNFINALDTVVGAK